MYQLETVEINFGKILVLNMSEVLEKVTVQYILIIFSTVLCLYQSFSKRDYVEWDIPKATEKECPN